MKYQQVTINGKSYLEIDGSDFELIFNPILSKGMAFTEEERDEFNLLGLIPPTVATIEEQRKRSHEAFASKATDLEKYIYLRDLQNSNETLFYSLLTNNITEMMPIVYTPTVGLGCQRYSRLYRRARGIFVAYPYRDRIDQILANNRFDRVEVIVVSDGERILGLGDLGANGIGIPIGKLSLYSACAGIHPDATLPVLLDAGTNNADLLNDPLYIGWRHERVRGAEYEELVEKFVTAVKKRFPHVLLQWEDFAQQNANPLLNKYRNQLCTFNDDIQGTAAVATGALLAAVEVTGVPLKDQEIVIMGAGSAGCGIASLMVQAMMEEGLSEKEACSHFYLIDRHGLLIQGMADVLPFQEKFLQDKNKIAEWKYQDKNEIHLLDVLKNVKATVLVGVSGQHGIFNEEVVTQMASQVARPIIFPLSNPTECCEAVPSDLIRWTNERVIIGTGSPFPDIMHNGKQFRVDQPNNSYIFPGMGLGLIAVQAKSVTDKMFLKAAKALAACSPARKKVSENILPPLTEIREISYQVALAVAEEAVAANLANITGSDLPALIKAKMWEPVYLPYRKKKI